MSAGGFVATTGGFDCSTSAPEAVTTIGGADSVFVSASCAAASFMLDVNAARAAACSGVSSARTEMKMKPAQTVVAQNVKRNLGNRINVFTFLRQLRVR